MQSSVRKTMITSTSFYPIVFKVNLKNQCMSHIMSRTPSIKHHCLHRHWHEACVGVVSDACHLHFSRSCRRGVTELRVWKKINAKMKQPCPLSGRLRKASARKRSKNLGKGSVSAPPPWKDVTAVAFFSLTELRLLTWNEPVKFKLPNQAWLLTWFHPFVINSDLATCAAIPSLGTSVYNPLSQASLNQEEKFENHWAEKRLLVLGARALCRRSHQPELSLSTWNELSAPSCKGFCSTNLRQSNFFKARKNNIAWNNCLRTSESSWHPILGNDESKWGENNTKYTSWIRLI